MAEKWEDRVRYICPICEKELKYGRHFCWNCKAFVEPWTYTGGLLPNESHSENHVPQTYLKPRSAGKQGGHMYDRRRQPKQYTYGGPNSAGRTRTQTPPNPYGDRKPENPYSSQPRRGITGCGTLIVVLVFFWFLIQILISIMM